MMGRTPQCYIPSFVEIGRPVPGKIFEGFLPYIWAGGHLGHVTWTIYKNFRIPFPRRLHIKQKAVKRGISRILSDIYFQEWNEKVNIPSKGKQYLLFKDNLNFEKYFINVSIFYYAKIVKYWTGNHRLPFETGRWDDTPLNERKCNVCNKSYIDDEYHHLFSFDFF